MHLTGLGRSSIYKFMAEGRFPMSISLGDRAIAWKEDEIKEWVQDKIDGRNSRVMNQLKEQSQNITEEDVISFIKGRFKDCNVADALHWVAKVFC